MGLHVPCEARNAQNAASRSVAGLLPGSHQAHIRMRSIACSGLMTISLLQVVNRLDAS